jgi:hypothetical protein
LKAVMVSLSERQQMRMIYDQFIGYQADPVGFYIDVLGMAEESVWSKMREVAESVRDNQLTAVPAGHSVSKTYGAGRLAVWFKTVFQPSTVITTAPSDNQVRGQLWREIHAAYSGSRVPLGGSMNLLQWDLKPEQAILDSLPPECRQDWEKNFAIGFSTSPDSLTEHATKMQGWHNEWLLVIIDEACGIMPQIWRTIMEGLVTNERVKVLAIGNATDPNSEFAQTLKDPDWHVVRISCLDTPNYKENREVIRGLADRKYVERIKARYGVQSNEFKIRVLGEFPTFKEGTYYGYEVSKARDKGQFGPEYTYDPTAKVHGFWDLGDVHTVGLFVQFRNSRIRLIDCYYDNKGRGLPEYVRAVDAKDYIWAKPHYAGPDLTRSNKKSMQTGLATRDVAAGLGMDIAAIPPHQFNDGIEAVRSIWPILDINSELCSEAIDAFGGYGKRKNERLSTEDKPVYYNEPTNTWHKHWADALRHLAIYYRYMTEEGFIGYATDEPQEASAKWDEHIDSEVYDPLGAYR